MKKTFISRGLIVAIASTSLSGLAAPAFAQDAAEEAEGGDIIVTARRRDESLQDTPIAITAINAAMIENKASTTIGDLMGAAPNLLITQQNSGAQAANLSIRGLTYADIEKSQEPTVGVVIDGVFIGTNTGQLLDFFDIQQVEVLRGPQGTLFGRNTIGGVINIQRTRPKEEFGGKAEVSYGKFNSLQTRAVFHVPIITDAGEGRGLFSKVFYFHSDSDGFHRNAVTGKLAGGSNNENFGISLLAKASDNFDALLTVEKLEQEFEPVNSNISRTGEVFCLFEPARECNRNTTTDLYTVFNSPAISRYKAPSTTLEMNLDLGGVKLTSVSSIRSSRELQTQDFDASTADLFYVNRRQTYRQFSQELRAAGDIGSNFDYVVGGYFFRSRYQLTQFTSVFGGALAQQQTTIDGRVYDADAATTTGKNRSIAIFGDFNLALAEKFRLSFGGRYTSDRKALDNRTAVVGLIGQGTGNFKKFTPKVGVDFRPNDDALFYASWSRGYRSGGFSPRAATIATASVAYSPETVDSYEVGAKFDLLDRRVQFNVAAFYSDYQDLQQNTTIPGGPTGNQTITSNVGSATIKGLEVDFNAKLVDGLRLNGSLGITDSKFKGFIAGNSIGNVLPTFTGTIPAGAAAILGLPLVNGGADPRTSAFTGTPTLLNYSSNRLIYAPKVTASIGAEYNVDLGSAELIFNLGYRYVGKYDQQISLGPITGSLPNAAFGATAASVVVTQPAAPLVVNGNDPRVRSDAQGLLDASITARFDLGGLKAKATLWGRNLADDRGTSAAFTVAGLFSFASAREPRTIGGTLGFEF
jgi:iron complex outermembrane recepter protein